MRMRITAFFVLASLMMPNSAAWELSTDEAQMMARCLWGECRGEDTIHQAAVAWCILNRVDDPRFPDTIPEVIGQPNQFTGYKASNPVDPDLLDLAMDVMCRWYRERDGEAEVGRIIPSEYVYFCRRNGHNAFGTSWPIGSETWDWSAEDPYSQEYIEEEIDNNDDERDLILSEYRHWTDYRMASDRSSDAPRPVRRRSHGSPRRY